MGRAAARDGLQYACRFQQEPLRRAFWGAWERARMVPDVAHLAARDGSKGGRWRIYIWHESQRTPASVYARVNCPEGAEIIVSNAPVRTDMARRVVRYHFT
jgi:hypothetical protein